jgi:hypothetical protein
LELPAYLEADLQGHMVDPKGLQERMLSAKRVTVPQFQGIAQLRSLPEVKSLDWLKELVLHDVLQHWISEGGAVMRFIKLDNAEP